MNQFGNEQVVKLIPMAMKSEVQLVVGSETVQAPMQLAMFLIMLKRIVAVLE